MKKILLVRAGSVYPEIRRVHGDFDQPFIRASELGADAFDVVDPARGDALPTSPSVYCGVLVSGSHSSAYDPEPWIRDIEALVRDTVDSEVPLLGVCFGAQVIATALGGRVAKNPRGPELGTVRIELNSEGRRDPLFEGLPSAFNAQASHNDYIEILPDGAELLASNAHTEVQAYRVGPKAHAVQFHPEIYVEMMRDIIRYGVQCEDVTAEEGEALENRLAPTPEATSLLRRFFSVAEPSPVLAGAYS